MRTLLGCCGLLLAVGSATVAAEPLKARPAREFLDSIGICTHIGQGVDNAAKAAAALAYAGVRNLRDDGSASHIKDWIAVHKDSGARVVLTWSGPTASSIPKLIDWSKQLAAAGALLAMEGPNEPNNWGVTFEGQKSGASALPLAKWMAEFYRQCKADPLLKDYPVFASSEAGGSEMDNVGLQFLTIPAGAGCLMPDGTVYADYANVHNYICRKPAIIDNMAWVNADPTFRGWPDGIYVEYGKTWRKGFAGYREADLIKLPRVTTETGWVTGPKGLTQEQQGRLYLNMYLAQFKQGFAHTFVYMLRDGGGGDAGYGIVDGGYHPKISATYLHNLTTLLADPGAGAAAGSLAYAIADPPATVHDLLLAKSDGTLELVVWNERAKGSDTVKVDLGNKFATVRVFDPTTGTAPTESHQQCQTVSLELSDHPLVIELTGRA
jgi:hypothetical protein